MFEREYNKKILPKVYRLNLIRLRETLKIRTKVIFLDIYVYEGNWITYRDTTLGNQSPPQYLARTGSFVELPS